MILTAHSKQFSVMDFSVMDCTIQFSFLKNKFLLKHFVNQSLIQVLVSFESIKSHPNSIQYISFLSSVCFFDTRLCPEFFNLIKNAAWTFSGIWWRQSFRLVYVRDGQTSSSYSSWL